MATATADGKVPHGEALAASPSKSVQIASGGIRTARDAGNFLSALIGDVMTEAVPARLANTSVNAMGKLLKVVEMQHKYGKPEDGNKSLVLSEDQPGTPDALEYRKRELLAEKAAVDAELSRLNASGKVA